MDDGAGNVLWTTIFNKPGSQACELTRRRIRSVSKLIKVGRVEPVMVLRVDKEKGYIDLSKRRVSPEDIDQIEERFNKSKSVHSIMRSLFLHCILLVSYKARARPYV